MYIHCKKNTCKIDFDTFENDPRKVVVFQFEPSTVFNLLISTQLHRPQALSTQYWKVKPDNIAMKRAGRSLK